MPSPEKLKLAKKIAVGKSLYNSQSPEKEDLIEKKLWEKFRSGDDGALIEIYKLYNDHLYNYGYQFCKDRETLKDVIQELFMYMLKKRDKLSRVNSLKGYLFSSIRRRLLRENSKRNKLKFEALPENNKEFDICFSAETIFIDSEITSEKKSHLEKAINQLTARQKEAILLFYYEGLSYKEISKTLDLNSVKSARKLIYRALSALKSNLPNAIISLILIVSIFF